MTTAQNRRRMQIFKHDTLQLSFSAAIVTTDNDSQHTTATKKRTQHRQTLSMDNSKKYTA